MGNTNLYYYPEWMFDGFNLKQHCLLEVSPEGEIVSMFETRDALPETTHVLKGLLMPGLINAHCHIELSHMKGFIPKHTGLPEFLKLVTTQRQTEHAAIIDAAQKAIQAMAESGIVAVGDICNTALLNELPRPFPLHIHHFVECFGLNEAQSLNRFMDALSVFHQLNEKGPCSMVLHAPYSVSPSLIKLVDDFNRNKISTIHHQESEHEHFLFLEKKGAFLTLFERVKFDAEQFYFYGQRSSEAVLQWNQQAKHLILVHNTASTATDIEWVENQELPTYWCLCPKANEYIENTLPNIPLLIQSNVKIVLGTDSLASNDSLNLWEEMALIQQHFPHIENSTLLQWATYNGAQALDIHNTFGSFELGKKPGILHLPDYNVTQPLPAQPYLSILHGATSFEHSA